MIKTAIFDYNGTLFKDDDINHICWKNTILEINPSFRNFDEFFKEFKSTKNSIILDAVKKRCHIDKLDVERWINIKEEKYRQMCIELKRNDLTPGAKELLDYLKEKNIKIALCTASIKSNVEFYYKHLNLDRWFSMDLTIYDSGEYINKKEMYEACFKITNSKPEQTIIFEDSLKAIEAVVNLGCQNIIEITNNINEPSKLKQVKQAITDFTKLDYSLIEIE